MSARTLLRRFQAWAESVWQTFAEAIAQGVWDEHGLSHPALRHAEAQQVATEVFRVQVEVPAVDPLRALVLSIAQATVEYVAEQDYESPADMFAERRQLAEEVARTAFACAAEWDDHPLNDVRAMVGGRR